jgi:membrane protease YdiL (CAAX protease family)
MPDTNDPSGTWRAPDGPTPWPQQLPAAGPTPGARVEGAADWTSAAGGVPPIERQLVDPPRPIRWGMGDVFVGLLVWLGAQLVAGIVVAVIYLATVEDINEVTSLSGDDLPLWALASGAIGSWLALAGWPAIVTYWKGQRSLKADFGWAFRWIDVPIGIAGGIVALIISVVASLGYALVSGDDAPTNTGIIPTDSVDVLTVIVLVLVVAVGTPIAEELFFRGLALGAARRAYGTAWGIVVSSLLFGLPHAFGAPTLSGAPFIVAVTAAFGAVLAGLRVVTEGRLAASIIGHAVINAVGVAAVLLTG